MPPAAGLLQSKREVTANFPEVGIFDHLGRDRGRYAEIFQVLVAGVDQLMGDLGTACRSGHDIAGANRIGLLAEAVLPLPLENHEQLMDAVVIVIGKRPLARRDHVQHAADAGRADGAAEAADLRLEALAMGVVAQRHVGDVHDGLGASANCPPTAHRRVACDVVVTAERARRNASTRLALVQARNLDSASAKVFDGLERSKRMMVANSTSRRCSGAGNRCRDPAADLLRDKSSR